MLTLFSILKQYGIDPAHVRLVRHGNKELPVLDTFRNDRERFEAYQGFQAPGRFGASRQIVVFAPLDGAASLLLGIWNVARCIENAELRPLHRELIDRFAFPTEWKTTSVFYDLMPSDEMSDLRERLVIDWGRAAISWVQSGHDKTVLEIRRPNSIRDFVSYRDVRLAYHELKQVVSSAGSNVTWKTALSSVNGVYLIRDTASGKLYVGSAYGKDGIFGRWRTYANTGHGENLMLKGLDPSRFEFSILEIAPATLSEREVVAIENKWKERLGTRSFGNLNSSEGH